MYRTHESFQNEVLPFEGQFRFSLLNEFDEFEFMSQYVQVQ